MKTEGRRRQIRPRCLVIAGPNGSGKTTFAREFLPNDAGIFNFINADLLASGLAPFRPANAAIAAARLFIAEVSRLAKSQASFAFESTLSGLSHAKRIRAWKSAGYSIEIVYLKIGSPQLALHRIRARVQQGGHDIPRVDVLRRFARSWKNFLEVYQPLADHWSVYDNSGLKPILMERGP